MSKLGQFNMWGEWKDYSHEVEPDKYEEATLVEQLHAYTERLDKSAESFIEAFQPPVQPQQDDSACIDCVRPLDRGPGGCRCWEKDL